ncbi:MAG: hypothetical protein H9Q65_03140 [Spiroplasma ixodetis]|nr:hypothetical protein [Spiroplasma ixodetis]MBP1527065.1 hypothetical protein [Spiroplasma ixodetis]MBP1528231.1 hypothetical protein [Spiroplasma ixodetis]
MTNKTKSQTYNFLSENKSIEEIKKQENIDVIEKTRHGGKTFKIIEKNVNNQLVNDDLSENEIFYDSYDTVDNLNNISTEEISQFQTTIQEQAKEIQKLKKENEELKLKQSNANLNKFKYNAVTIYNEKQRKKTGIEKIHEEILPIKDEIIFVTTLVHINNSITEEVIDFQELTNGNIEVMKQLKKYENINKYKDDLLLIEPNSNYEKNIKIEPVSIKKFLSEQEKISNWKISKLELIIFISLSLLSITLLAIPVVVPALVPIISTILWEKTLVSIVGIGIAWIVNKGIWTIATEKTKKVESWMKQKFYSLIRKIPFVNKRNLGKTKEELEIKKNVEKNIENLTSNKLETKLKTQYDILKQELDNRKDKKLDEIISNETINHKSNSVLENSSIESENNQNFDSSIRNTINHQNQQPSTISTKTWNKVKCLLT